MLAEQSERDRLSNPAARSSNDGYSISHFGTSFLVNCFVRTSRLVLLLGFARSRGSLGLRLIGSDSDPPGIMKLKWNFAMLRANDEPLENQCRPSIKSRPNRWLHYRCRVSK